MLTLRTHVHQRLAAATSDVGRAIGRAVAGRRRAPVTVPRSRLRTAAVGATTSQTRGVRVFHTGSTSASDVTPTPSSTSASSGPPFRLVLFASSEFSLPTLHALHAHASSLLVGGTCVVVTPADKPVGRGKVVSESAFKRAALDLGFTVVQLPPDIDFRMTSWSLPPHLLGAVDVGVVVSFGYMLPQSLISCFPQGMINIHPSLLPLYRGASPIQFSLAHGDTRTGVSIIDVHPSRMDGGDVVSQVELEGGMPRGSTFRSLSPVLARQGASQLINVLQNLATAREKQQAQVELETNGSNSAANTTTVVASAAAAPVDPRASAPRIPKSAGELLFGRHTATLLYRVWAACTGFTPVFTHFQKTRILLHELVHPEEAREALLQAQAAAAAAQSDTNNSTTASSSSASHFPTLADARRLGPGGIFFEPTLQAIGVVCGADASTANGGEPSVLYVTSLQLAGKKTPVSALVFAHGYLDKRRVKTDDQLMRTWRFTPSADDAPDFFGPKLEPTTATPTLPRA